MAIEHLFLCGGAPEPKRTKADRKLHSLALHGRGRNVTLKLSNISRPLAVGIPPRVLDLLEIAGYVYAADQLVSRGGRVGHGVGKDWHRVMHLEIPVRLPGFWKRPKVSALIHRTLSFLAGEEWKISFEKLRNAPPEQSYLDFGEDWAPHPDAVLLFSGGLDSLAGLVEEIKKESKRIALVTHLSNPKTASLVRRLVQGVKERAGSEVELIHIPVWADKSSKLTKDTTQRTRSFLYAALGMAVASLAKSDVVRIYENGVVSLHLPITSELVGARASRSTHPCAIRYFDELANLVVQGDLTVENPFMWSTKADVVKVLRDSRYAPLIGQSESCGGTFQKTKAHTHCGVCSQCVDRRLAIVGADASQYEDASNYKERIELDARDGPARTMVEAYLKTAREFVQLDPLHFVSKYPEIHRAAGCLPGSVDVVVRKMIDLLKHHGETVMVAVEKKIVELAPQLARGEIPSSSALFIGAEEEVAGNVGAQYEARTSAGRKVLCVDEYRRLVESSGDYDVFFDGVALRAESKVKDELWMGKVSAGEAELLWEYVESGKLVSPNMTSAARRHRQREDAAKEMFKRARRKIDGTNERGEWALFKTRRGGWGVPTKYRFDPDKSLKYCFIRPL